MPGAGIPPTPPGTGARVPFPAAPPRDAPLPAIPPPSVPPWPRPAAERFRPADPRAARWESRFRHRAGNGASVALVDTGLDRSSPFFRGGSVDVVDLLGTGTAGDPSGHGTRGAALLLCPAPDGTAPALAGAVFLTVFRAVGGGSRPVARALRLAAARRVDVVALPFGRLLPDPEVAEALAELRAAGTEILAAAGNRGADHVLFPASARGVLAVSGADANGAVLAECPAGAAVRVLAPGLVRCPLDGQAMRGSSAAVVMAAGLRALALGTPGPGDPASEPAPSPALPPVG